MLANFSNRILKLKLNHFITKINVAQEFYSATTANFLKNMASWEVEKDKYLRMEAEAKRKDCVKLQNILTWKSLAESTKLPEPIEMKENCAINISKNEILAEQISIFEGDITTLAVDAIVNAANSSLLGGGGVDGAIHRAAGSSLKDECKTLGGCQVGEAKITGGYKLPSRYVIHTVGPQGEYPEKLKKCYRNSLEVLVSKKLRTIAFPCISTGIYGFPSLPAAHAAAYQVRKYLEDNSDKIDRVIFCLFLDEDKKIYKGILQSYFPISN